MTADEVIQSLRWQIRNIKQSVKSDNSEYLTGYLCALSAVEGMIDEAKPDVKPEAITVLDYLKGKSHEIF